MAVEQAPKTWRECYFEPREQISDKWDAYFEVYDRHFSRYRSQPRPTYIEIGCQNGGSLETARRYFGAGARIFGVDIDPACAALNGKPFVDKVFIGDSSDTKFLSAVYDEIGTPDIILDDGSHKPYDIVQAFQTGFPRLADRGVYLVEDTCCDFYKSHRTLFNRQTATEYFSSLNAQLSLNMSEPELLGTRFLQPLDQRDGKYQRKTGIVANIYAIAFYESMIAIEKRTDLKEPLRHIRK